MNTLSHSYQKTTEGIYIQGALYIFSFIRDKHIQFYFFEFLYFMGVHIKVFLTKSNKRSQSWMCRQPDVYVPVVCIITLLRHSIYTQKTNEHTGKESRYVLLAPWFVTRIDALNWGFYVEIRYLHRYKTMYINHRLLTQQCGRTKKKEKPS